jgi:hypothetical protein
MNDLECRHRLLKLLYTGVTDFGTVESQCLKAGLYRPGLFGQFV